MQRRHMDKFLHDVSFYIPRLTSEGMCVNETLSFSMISTQTLFEPSNHHFTVVPSFLANRLAKATSVKLGLPAGEQGNTELSQAYKPS